MSLLNVHKEKRGAVRDAIDVIEIADDLHCDCDLFFGEMVLDEPVKVRFVHGARLKRQFGRKIAKRAVFPAQRREPVIVDQLVGSLVLSGLRTEVLRMGERSVIAIVDIADDGSEHFFARLAERVFGFHQANAEVNGRFGSRRVAAHHLDDIRDAAGAGERGVVKPLHGASRFGLIREFQKCHWVSVLDLGGKSWSEPAP